MRLSDPKLLISGAVLAVIAAIAGVQWIRGFLYPDVFIGVKSMPADIGTCRGAGSYSGMDGAAFNRLLGGKLVLMDKDEFPLARHTFTRDEIDANYDDRTCIVAYRFKRVERQGTYKAQLRLQTDEEFERTFKVADDRREFWWNLDDKTPPRAGRGPQESTKPCDTIFKGKPSIENRYAALAIKFAKLAQRSIETGQIPPEDLRRLSPEADRLQGALDAAADLDEIADGSPAAKLSEILGQLQSADTPEEIAALLGPGPANMDALRVACGLPERYF